MTQFYGTLTPEKTEREEKNMQLVRKGAGECMVLLENDGVLPLKKIGKIALYGAGARHTIKGGTGSGDVNSREVINVDAGSCGCRLYDHHQTPGWTLMPRC